MSKHEMKNSRVIGKIVLKGVASLTLAGIGAGVACIMVAGEYHREEQHAQLNESSSKVMTASSTKEATNTYITKKTPGLPDRSKDPIQFFRDTFNDYTYDDSCPGYLPNLDKTITNVTFTKFAADFFNPVEYLEDSNITEPYELYDTLCDYAICQWEGNIGFKQGGYVPVDGDIIIFSDIPDFDNEDPTHYVSCVAYGDNWNIVMRNSLVTKICYGSPSDILGDIQKKLGTNYQYMSIFTIDQGEYND